jgi:NAD(P)-dependent dehydrogenase (short-subunit alcohol dehydrogenase family)
LSDLSVKSLALKIDSTKITPHKTLITYNMKIIIVGATGTMGKHLSSSFEKKHEIIRASSKGGDIQVDITDPHSVEQLFKTVGPFDALICTAGPTHVGPWSKMTPADFKKGLEGKLIGQANLVLIGQHYISPKGSFTLITGALTHEPVPMFANASSANGAIESFVRAAAIELENGIRINAVSPTVIEDSPQYFQYFQGDIPVTMRQLEYGFRKSVFGAGTGQVIKPY